MDIPSNSPRSRFVRKVLIDLSIMTAIGVVLALIGPFGSFAEPLAYRLVSWVVFAWIGYAIYSPMGWFVDRLHAALDLPKPALWVVAVMIATVPMTTIVWVMGFLPNPVHAPSLEEALTSYFYVLVVGGGVTAFFYMIESRGSDQATAPGTHSVSSDGKAQPEPTLIDTQPRLVDRLPPELGAEIIALEMELSLIHI